MNVLVAGASGFIGKNFILRAPKDWSILGLYNTDQSFPQFLETNQLTSVTPLQIDLQDSSAVRDAFTKQNEFDICLFVLGNSDIGLSARDPLFDLKANVHTLINLVTNIKVKKFMFMSSGTVYLGAQGAVNEHTPTEPLVPYGLNKLSSELHIKFFQEKTDHINEYVILRFFGAYGPMELPRKIYTNLIKNFVMENKDDYAVFGSGENSIDAMYIDDTIDGLMKVIESDQKNIVVDFCKGEPCSINDLVKEVGKIFGKGNIKINHTGESSEFISFHADPKRMQDLFGFRATTPLSVGMKKFADYLKAQEESLVNIS